MIINPSDGIKMLWVSRRPVAKGFRVYRHSHSWWQYLLVENGEILTTVDGKYAYLSRHQTAMIPGNKIHSFVATTDAQIIEIKFHLYNDYFKNVLGEKTLMGSTSKEIIETAKAIVDEGIRRDFSYKEMSTLLLSQLLLLHVREILSTCEPPLLSRLPHMRTAAPIVEQLCKDDSVDCNVAKIVQYMDEHMEKPLTLNTLAQHFGYTRSYLCQMFSSSIGISPMRCLALLRLDRAQDLLATSTFSLQHISSLCGFRSSHQMWRLFRAEVGCSPTEFRQRHADTKAAAINFTGLRESQWTQIV